LPRVRREDDDARVIIDGLPVPVALLEVVQQAQWGANIHLVRGE
jgi:hypothetical protein